MRRKIDVKTYLISALVTDIYIRSTTTTISNEPPGLVRHLQRDEKLIFLGCPAHVSQAGVEMLSPALTALG